MDPGSTECPSCQSEENSSTQTHISQSQVLHRAQAFQARSGNLYRPFNAPYESAPSTSESHSSDRQQSWSIGFPSPAQARLVQNRKNAPPMIQPNMSRLINIQFQNLYYTAIPANLPAELPDKTIFTVYQVGYPPGASFLDSVHDLWKRIWQEKWEENSALPFKFE